MKLQEKAIKLISFKDNNAQVNNLFAQSKILKFKDFVCALLKYKPCQKLNCEKWSCLI